MKYIPRTSKLKSGLISKTWLEDGMLRRDLYKPDGSFDSAWYRYSASEPWKPL